MVAKNSTVLLLCYFLHYVGTNVSLASQCAGLEYYSILEIIQQKGMTFQMLC